MASTAAPAVTKPLLPVQDPVPSDIDIAQSIQPKHISQIAEVALGLQPQEYELYGPTKAKVRGGWRVGRARARRCRGDAASQQVMQQLR